MNAWYNRNGDILHVTIEAVDSYSEWHPSGVHLLRALDDRRIVGVDVWWLSRIVRKGFEPSTPEEREAGDKLLRELFGNVEGLPAAVPDYAGEIVDASLPTATLGKLAAEHPPPQAWYDETGNPMEPAHE